MTTTRCSEAIRRGRMAKATQFHVAAEMIDALADEGDLIDAYVTLCVHAGIAAADVICCARLGEHAQGHDHAEAIRLLERVDKPLAGSLGVLLRAKTSSGYSSAATSQATRKAVGRSAARLVAAAEGV